MGLFVGLDSGGTKTDCWVGDEARVLGRAQCGTVKLTRVEREVATERLRELLRAAALDAGVSLQAVTRTCVGVAGYGIAEVREWAGRVVGEMVGGAVEVCGDDEIALDAAFFGGAGVLVIGGTGSVVFGRDSAGRKYQCGGWGPGVGDEGSGFWIGREAVRLGFRARDRGVATGLLEAVRLAWGLEHVGAVVGFANSRASFEAGPDFAGLVPAVVGLAAAGDEVARGLLVRAGEELGEQVLVVAERMGEGGLELAFTGSIVEKVAVVREAMVKRIGGQLLVRSEAVNSMEGAMWRARGGAVV